MLVVDLLTFVLLNKDIDASLLTVPGVLGYAILPESMICTCFVILQSTST